MRAKSRGLACIYAKMTDIMRAVIQPSAEPPELLEHDMTEEIPKPSEGLLTFEAEGQEGGPYHSRRLHVPTAASGLTIGRGYDMKLRTKSEIRDDLLAVGLAASEAVLISQAAGLKGEDAEEFVEENNLEDFEITPEQQVTLFEFEYGRKLADIRRLATKPDVTRAYGATDWPNLDQAIKEVLVDLRFRGDYTPSSRKFLQVHVANNDLQTFAEVIADRAYWPNVPLDRFERRKERCEAAIA